MPEGPSIVILKEEAQQFTGKKVVEVSGNSKEDIGRALNKKVMSFKSWGKHFLICFSDFSIRIHLVLFGSYRINEAKEVSPRLSLKFAEGELNFYNCSLKIIEGNPDEVYDWSTDVMSDEWDAKAAKGKLKHQPDILACDALLNQQIFSGSGNIIKNEVLYRIKVHPESRIGSMPAPKINEMIKEVRQYSFEFLEWKKAFVLKQHWLVHTKQICVRCDIPLKKSYFGKTNRRTFYCNNCQIKYVE